MNYLDTRLKDIKNGYIQHFGILGMKWGIRKYQNPDGTLTDAGKKRYMQQARHYYDEDKEFSKLLKEKRPNNFINRITDSRKKSEKYKKMKDGNLRYIPRDAYTGSDRDLILSLQKRARNKRQVALDYLTLDNNVRKTLKNKKSKYDIIK